MIMWLLLVCDAAPGRLSYVVIIVIFASLNSCALAGVNRSSDIDREFSSKNNEETIIVLPEHRFIREQLSL